MEREAPMDFISNIPNEIQMQILSRLPRKDAIKTSVLSRSWFALWTLWKPRFPYSTKLRFCPTYRGDDPQGVHLKIICDILVGYKNQNKKIEKYKVDFNPGNRYEKPVLKMIKTAVSCGVEELDLNFSQGFQSEFVNGTLRSRRKKPELKGKIFEGNSIACLSLGYCRIHQYFKFKEFKALQYLKFHGVNITESKLNEIMRNCRGLQTLVITECLQLKNFRINFPVFKLRTLIILKCTGLDRIHVIAPNLRKFHFICFLPISIEIIGSRLEEVVWVSTAEMNYYRSNHFWPTFKMHRRMQTISMCNMGMQHLIGPDPPLERATHLENLRVVSIKMIQLLDNDVMDLYRFFNHCNLLQLRSLIIVFPRPGEYLTIPRELNNEEVPPEFRLMNLSSIKMTNFDGGVQQLTLLRYLLSRANKLLFAQLVLLPSFDLENSRYSMMNMLKEVGKARVDDAEIMLETADGLFELLP